MNGSSRTQNSVRNSMVGIVVQCAGVLLSFLTRCVFVSALNEEYLGVNGLFSNILTVLSLAELGVGTAIIYSLYKPIADKNEEEISALINYYRKAYLIIGVVITILGVAISPFLNILIKDTPDIPHLTHIYILFLANTSVSYLFAYRRALFTADQREYLLSKYRFFFNVIKAVGQCCILILSRNFILYLLVQIACTSMENIYVHFRANRLYPFLKEHRNAKLSKEKVEKITTDIKALMIYKVGSTALDGTDNIILSMFVGVIWVGKLSNYTLILSAVAMVAAQAVNAVTASVGNYIAKEASDRYEDLLFKMTYLSFCIYGFSFVALASLLSPFISMVFGTQYVLNNMEVLVLSLNFYIFGMMNSIWTFRTTMGLFTYGKYRPLVSAVINIVVSVILARYIGLIGVLLGTTITRVLTNVWYDPYIVYKYGMKKKVANYYRKWIYYLILSLSALVIVSSISTLFYGSVLLVFILRCILCVVVFFAVTILMTYKSTEYRFLKGIILSFKGMLKKF